MSNYTVKQAHRMQDLAEKLESRELTLKAVREICADEFPDMKIHTGRCTREVAFKLLTGNAQATYEYFESGDTHLQENLLDVPAEPESKGKQIGYIRVSAAYQNTERQLSGMKLDRMFEDKCSGSTTERPQLQAMLDYVREGDVIHVHSIDRFARSMRDLQNMVTDLQAKGVGLVFKKENLTFGANPSPMDKLLFNMLGAFAEFEREMIRERQAEGIAKAKEKGVYQGRKPDTDKHERIKKLRAEGVSLRKIAEKVGCSLSSVQRALGA